MLLFSCRISSGEADQIASTYFGLGFLDDLADLLGNAGFGGGPEVSIDNPLLGTEAGTRSDEIEVA